MFMYDENNNYCAKPKNDPNKIGNIESQTSQDWMNQGMISKIARIPTVKFLLEK